MQKKSDTFVNVEKVHIKFKFRSENKLKNHISRIFNNKINYFYALKNISFNAKKGDVFGVIGKNGSGKSTLLKTIAGIYKPDKGEIKVIGKTFLMDLKNGFNQDIDGISNIYLINSMNQENTKETKKKIKKIIEFSGLKNFIHEPINNYSSGMIIRLSFAIGIHSNYDILLLDETFAVGDSEFRKKSYNALQKIIETKDKIIFIASHNEDLIKKFCNKKINLT